MSPSRTVVKFLNDKGNDVACQRRQDRLYLSLGLLLLLLGTSSLGLDVFVVDGQRLVNLGLQGSFILNAKVEKSVLQIRLQEKKGEEGSLQVDKLRVVHLQEHTSDLASKFRVDGLNLGEDQFSKNLLLLGRLGRSKLRLEQRGSVVVASRLVREVAVATSVVVTAVVVAAQVLAVVGGVARHSTLDIRRHAGDVATTTLRSATAASSKSGSLLLSLLHGSHELRSSGLSKLRRELAGDAVHVGGNSLGNVAATLLGVSGELARATSLNVGKRHSGLGERHATTTLGDEAWLLARSIENGGLHVLLRHTSCRRGLLHPQLVASLDTSLKLALADVLALGEGNVQRLVVDHPLVHLGNSLGGIVGVAKADEAEALALTKLLVALLFGLLLSALSRLGLVLGLLLVLLVLLLILDLLVALLRGVPHDLGRGDGAKLGEHLSELLIVNVVIKVLDVQVDALVLVGLLKARGLIRLSQLLFTLMLLLGTANIELLAAEVLAVEILNSLVGSLVGGEVDETETARLALLVAGQRRRGNIAKLLKQLTELVVGDIRSNVLHVNVGEVGLHLLELALAVLLGDVVADVDLLLVEQHAVDMLDGLSSSLIGLVVNETVSLGVSVLILGDLAAENVAKGSKGVVESLVINSNVQVLDEHIALAGLAQSGVTLGPHDTARAALDEGVVELLQSLLAIGGGVVVHIGVAKRAAGDSVTADTDGSNGTNLREELKEHGLGDGGVKLSNVERGRVLGVRSGGGGRSRSILSTSADGSVDGRSLDIAAAIEGCVVEIAGELVNSVRGGVGGHFVG